MIKPAKLAGGGKLCSERGDEDMGTENYLVARKAAASMNLKTVSVASQRMTSTPACKGGAPEAFGGRRRSFNSWAGFSSTG